MSPEVKILKDISVLLAEEDDAKVKEDKWRALLESYSAEEEASNDVQESAEPGPPAENVATPSNPPAVDIEPGSVGASAVIVGGPLNPPDATFTQQTSIESELSSLSSVDGEKEGEKRGGNMGEETQVGGSSAVGVFPPPPQHPKTGGKSLELLGIKPSVGERKVTLIVKRKAEEDERDEDDRMDVDWASESSSSEEEVPRPKKKQRIVSSATVETSEEEEKSKAVVYVGKSRKLRKNVSTAEKDIMPVIPQWPVYESENACIPCQDDGWKCWSFIPRQRGRKRLACVHCFLRKKKCNLADERAAALSMERREMAQEAEDTEEEKPKKVVKKKSHSRGKSKTADREERPRKVKDKGKQKEVDQRGEKGKGKEKGIGKGKGKGKGKEKAMGKEIEIEKGSDAERRVKTEDDLWTTSELHFFIISMIC